MSCSATRGANLFRVPRDEALMAAILAYVARFAREHGGEGAPPPPEDLWWGEPEYHALLEALLLLETLLRVRDDAAIRIGEHI